MTPNRSNALARRREPAEYADNIISDLSATSTRTARSDA